MRFDGNRLREARKASGLSQEALGQKVGKHAFQISNYERGRNEPRTATVVALAREVGVPVEALFGPDEDEEAALAATLLWAVRQVVDNKSKNGVPA